MNRCLVVILALLTACSAAERPDVHLADLRLGEMRAFETELVVGLRVQNPASSPVTINGASYRLYFNGVRVGRGMSSQTITVPAFGSAIQNVTLQVSNLSLLPTIQQLLESDAFAYRIEGTLHRSGLFGDVSVQESGRFSMRDAGYESDRRGN